MTCRRPTTLVASLFHLFSAATCGGLLALGCSAAAPGESVGESSAADTVAVADAADAGTVPVNAPAPPPPAAPPPSSTLANGGTLTSGQSLTNGNYTLVMQSDCNLVLYNNGVAVWSSGTNGQGTNCSLVMQSSDCNLVIYNGAPPGNAVWASNTASLGAFRQCSLTMQADGNAVVYTGQGTAVWDTGGFATAPPALQCSCGVQLGTTPLDGDSNCTTPAYVSFPGLTQAQCVANNGQNVSSSQTFYRDSLFGCVPQTVLDRLTESVTYWNCGLHIQN
jgi:hypothetical protein